MANEVSPLLKALEAPNMQHDELSVGFKISIGDSRQNPSRILQPDIHKQVNLSKVYRAGSIIISIVVLLTLSSNLIQLNVFFHNPVR